VRCTSAAGEATDWRDAAGRAAAAGWWHSRLNDRVFNTQGEPPENNKLNYRRGTFEYSMAKCKLRNEYGLHQCLDVKSGDSNSFTYV